MNKPEVIFYGAGQYARDNFDDLLTDYNPLCFVDMDSAKQNTLLNGVVILSLEKALHLYPDNAIVVTVDIPNIEKVVSYLIHERVDIRRILLHNAEKRKGCLYLEQTPWIALSGLRAEISCLCFGDLRINRTGGGVQSDILEISHRRNKVRQNLSDGIPTCCDDCCVNMEDYYPLKIFKDCKLGIVFESNYLDTTCNARCVYCVAHDNARYVTNKSELKAGRSFIQDWRELVKHYKDDHIFVAFVNGEITASRWRDECFNDLLSNCKKWRTSIASNCFIYNKNIAALMNQKRCIFTTSYDCGNACSFKKIKGVDRFDKVIDNTKKYLDSCDINNPIIIKYIMLEGENCDEDNIFQFCDIVSGFSKNKISVCISNDNFSLDKPVTQNVRHAVLKFVRRLTELNIPFNFGRHAFRASDFQRLRELAECKTVYDVDKFVWM